MFNLMYQMPLLSIPLYQLTIWKKFHLHYTLVNSFLNNPYEVADKYGITSFQFQQELDNLTNQLETLPADNLNFMYSQFMPSNLIDLRSDQ